MHNCSTLWPPKLKKCKTSGFLVTSTGAQPSMHTILTPQMLNWPNANLDSITNRKLQIIPNGVNQVCRLGSWKVNFETSILTYSILVDTNVNGLLQYNYAAVLQNPQHPCYAQPYFQVRILDSTGTPYNNPYGVFTYVAGTPNAIFNNEKSLVTGDTINWFNWQTVGVSLKPYHGKT